MHETNINRLDLNLLVVFDAVYAHRSVTGAARKLALSQPAVSHALGRLRDVTGDVLFVRAGRGLTPTPRADVLAGPVRDALGVLARAMQPATFDPVRADRVFRIGVSDYALVTLGLPLMRLVRRAAPGVVLEFRSWEERSPELLETGALDAAFWGGGEPVAPLQSSLLFRGGMVGVLCAGHPLAASAEAGVLSLNDYLAYPHILASWRPPHRSPIDAVLEGMGRARRIAVVTPHFAANIAALRGTDLILTLPQRLLPALDMRGLVSFTVPLTLPDYAYRLIWHPRSDGDPGLIWLRGSVRRAVDEAATQV